MKEGRKEEGSGEGGMGEEGLKMEVTERRNEKWGTGKHSKRVRTGGGWGETRARKVEEGKKKSS